MQWFRWTVGGAYRKANREWQGTKRLIPSITTLVIDYNCDNSFTQVKWALQIEEFVQVRCIICCTSILNVLHNLSCVCVCIYSTGKTITDM